MSQKLTRTEAPDLTYGDVDKLIEIAARKEQAASERLDLVTLKEIADDLGIAPEHVETAVSKLEQRRRDKALRLKKRHQRLKKIAIGSGAALVVISGFAWMDQTRLRSDLSEARQQQSQVANVVERHQTTAEYFADRPDSTDRSAELQGALNRVSVETRRYDEAASQYNSRASGFPSTLWVGLSDLPSELPLSDEIDEW